MANSFINKKADLTTTDLTTLYTVPSFKSAVVKSLLVSEDAGSGSTITITLVNASGTIFNLFKDKSIASKATTELLTQPLVMEESEVLKVQAADANELHVIASVIEPKEIITTITNMKTGEVYKDDSEWKAKNIPESDIRKDVRVIMPSLDLFGETK
jgi:hypothetical protein